MSAEFAQWPQDHSSSRLQAGHANETILNVMVRWLERHARVWVGTRSELLEELKNGAGENELPASLSPADLSNTIEVSIEELRRRGIHAEVCERAGTARLISLRLVRDAAVLPFPVALPTTDPLPTNSSRDSNAQSPASEKNKSATTGIPNEFRPFLNENAASPDDGVFSLASFQTLRASPWNKYLRNEHFRKALAPATGILLVAIVCGAAYLGIFVAPHLRTAPVSARNTSQVSLANLRKLAENGDSRAQYELAVRYGDGDGVPKDDAQAMEWLRKSAMQRHALAQFVLGNLLTETDIVAGYSWLFLADFNGSAMAGQTLNTLTPRLTQSQIADVRLQIGRMFATGAGVPPDNVAAYTWYELSRRAGSKLASKEQLELKAKMSRAEIAEGNKRASDWTRSR